MLNTKLKKTYSISASLLAGVFLAGLILLNSALGQKIGILESSFMAHLTGSILAFLIVVFSINRTLIKNVIQTPKYLFIGGILGILITVIGNIAAPTIGLLLHLSILTTLELILSATVDHFGLFGLPRFKIDFRRGLGLVLSIMGVMLIFWS